MGYLVIIWFLKCYLVVGGFLSGFHNPAWIVIKPKTFSKVVDWLVYGLNDGAAFWHYWTDLKGFTEW